MNDISFGFLLGLVKQNKKTLSIVTLAAFVWGVVAALSIPKTYKSSTSLAAETKDDSPLGSSSLGGLASLAGVSLSGGNDAIVPELYPNVVVTNDFLVDLLYAKVATQDGGDSIRYIDYMLKRQTAPWWTKAAGAVARFLSGDKAAVGQGKRIDPQSLTRKEEELVKGLKGQIVCAVDKSDGIINISFTSQDPLVSKQMVELVTRHLQEFITDYRTNKARIDLDYYCKLRDEAYAKYGKAKQEYAAYSDSHADLALKSYQLESESLENALQLAYTEYSQKCQQVALAEGKVQERTPAFTVIERASVPARHDSPKRLTLVLAYVFVAFFGTYVYLFVREQWRGGKSAPEEA